MFQLETGNEWPLLEDETNGAEARASSAVEQWGDEWNDVVDWRERPQTTIRKNVYEDNPWAAWNAHGRQNGNDWSSNSQDNPWAAWNAHGRQNGNDWSSNSQDPWQGRNGRNRRHGRNRSARSGRSGQKDNPWAAWNVHGRQNGNDWSSNSQEDPWAAWNVHGRQNGNDWSSNTQDNAWSGWDEQSGQNGNDWSNNAQARASSAVEQWGWNEVDWREQPQTTIRKNVYEECAKEAAVSRTPEEVERIRQSHFIEIVDGCSDQVPNLINSFDEACFPNEMLDLLRKRFEEPTPIQKQIWPLALQGRDVVGIAEPGSGKTEAYLLPMICHISHQEELEAGDGPIAVVLASTRELAIQIQEQCELFGSLKDLKSCFVVGGTPASELKTQLEEKHHILVATPGRFINALEEGWIVLNRASYLVLDEADEMRKKEDFHNQIKKILGQVRNERQVLMFTATWPEVCSLAKEICTDSDGMPPVFVRIGGDKLAAYKYIEQHTVVVHGDEDKYDKLKERLQSPETFTDGGKAIIFCRTRGAVRRLHEQLKLETVMWKDGESLVGTLHGEMHQSDRDWVMRQFRQGDLPCVVSTGVLARGREFLKVNLVVSYDVPRDVEMYIHRVDCAGPAGSSMIFVDTWKYKELKAAHDVLMDVLRATDQTVKEDFKEAVEYYEQWQNQAATTEHARAATEVQEEPQQEGPVQVDQGDGPAPAWPDQAWGEGWPNAWEGRGLNPWAAEWWPQHGTQTWNENLDF